MAIDLRISAIVICLSAFGCSQPIGTNGAPTSSDLSASRDYQLRVVEGQNVLASLTLADITALPSVKISRDGKDEEGPTLLSILGKAGVMDFKRVTVVGMQKGRSHSAALPLDRSKVNDKVILSANQRGQTKMASPDIPGELWIVDVSTLEVER